MKWFHELSQREARDIVTVALVYRQDVIDTENGRVSKFFRRTVRLSVKKVSFSDNALVKRIEKFLMKEVKPPDEEWFSYDMQISIPLYKTIEISFITGDTISQHTESTINTISLSDEISLIDVISIDIVGQ